jgi:hypothetical protein
VNLLNMFRLEFIGHVYKHFTLKYCSSYRLTLLLTMSQIIKLCQEYNRLSREIELSIERKTAQDDFVVKGRFKRGVDIFNLAYQLDQDARNVGAKNFTSLVRLNENCYLSDMIHTYNDSQTIYIKESDGFFCLFGFTEFSTIVNTVLDIEYIIDMQ